MDNYFIRLSQLDVSSHVEKKGQFAYLSWPWAVAQLRSADPAATWEVRRFDGLPYLKSEAGYFVEVAVSVQGVTLSQIHPVLDACNRPIHEPSAFDINTSLQRALVKAIALHGLGLSLYAGEDLPLGTEREERRAESRETRKVVPLADPQTLSEEQQQRIRDQLVTVGGSLDRLLAYFKVTALAEIPTKDFDRVMRSLAKGRKAAA
jgi:hypothetical protein